MNRLMQEKNYMSLDSSILYRCNQKYYDKLLANYGIGYTQMLLLCQIFEHEGISMNELAGSGSFDKGTITKSIQKLVELSYISVENSTEDKRAKLLYTTEKTHAIMPDLYVQKQKWFNFLTGDLTEEEKDMYVRAIAKITAKARSYNETHLDEGGIKIYGLQKLTLLDYPGHMAATLFTGGCNFRCPFCHNRSLVFLEEAEQEIAKEEVLDYLEKRSKVLDGVCITGGEPLVQPEIKEFIREIKNLGLKVKLDTNGSFFEKMKELIEEGLVDYVAMDIKNSKEKYAKTIGKEMDLSNIEKSVKYLLEGHVDYEFRTTVVKEFHEREDFKKIGEWIRGAKRYYLQNFEDHGSCIMQGLHPVEIKELEEFKDTVRDYVEMVSLRGVEE